MVQKSQTINLANNSITDEQLLPMIEAIKGGCNTSLEKLICMEIGLVMLGARHLPHYLKIQTPIYKLLILMEIKLAMRVQLQLQQFG